DLEFLVCVQNSSNNGGEYEIVTSNMYFENFATPGEKLQLPDYLTATRDAELAISLNFDHKFKHEFLPGLFDSTHQQEKFRKFIGLVGFRTIYEAISLNYVDQLVPLSISVVGNFAPYDQPKFFCNGDEDAWTQNASEKIIDDFVDYALLASKHAA